MTAAAASKRESTFTHSIDFCSWAAYCDYSLCAGRATEERETAAAA